MACVTLKRPLDFDPLHSPNRPPNKRPRRCLPLSRQSLEASSSLMASPSPRESVSVFRESPLSAGEIAVNLRDELKRLKRRRALVVQPEQHTSMMDSPASPSSSINNTSPSSPPAHSSSREKPIFTLKQMTLICERMCKERTDQVREEYDKILHQKLTEQYDAFVKFVDHQIQQRFNDSQTPSYLS